MKLYAESSAVLSWLFREPMGAEASRLLRSASLIFASELTLLECDRALRAAEARGRLDGAGARTVRAWLDEARATWNVYRIGAVIMGRARRTFPCEPVRALDALHLATALHVAEFERDLTVLTFDRRIRSNAAALGLEVAPAHPESD
ncbi:MAG: type II toxin-antitoxin system VapC family toxin [Acidobacteria bacterium]|nr:type II toxin-antitoxin system VapC family toxin [Acidobacteriota bacterium]